MPNSNINCREPVATEETVPFKECPKLMNAACFTSASYHTSLKGEYDRDRYTCDTVVDGLNNTKKGVCMMAVLHLLTASMAIVFNLRLALMLMVTIPFST